MQTNDQSQIGLSLIEVSVALALISAGLLALTQLQITAMRLSDNAIKQSYVNLLANNLIEASLSNPEESYQFSSGTSFAALDCFKNQQCSTAQLRQHHLYYWHQQLQALLPNATATLQSHPTWYRLEINWQSRFNEAQNYLLEFKRH